MDLALRYNLHIPEASWAPLKFDENGVFSNEHETNTGNDSDYTIKAPALRTLIVARMLGDMDVMLYDGSMAEWGLDTSVLVETGGPKETK